MWAYVPFHVRAIYATTQSYCFYYLHYGCLLSFEGSLSILHLSGALNRIIQGFVGAWQYKGCQICLAFFPSFLSAAAYNSVARWTLFFTINSLTSNLERHLGLLLELDNFLGKCSEVVEMSEDVAFWESLYTFVDFLLREADIFSRLGRCLMWWINITSLKMYR